MPDRDTADDSLSIHQPFNESRAYLRSKPITDTAQHEPEKDHESKALLLKRTECSSEEPYLYFQNFIRRMGRASARTIYHRMTELWAGISEEDMKDVLTEKQLWAFGAFHDLVMKESQHSDAFRPSLLYPPSTVCAETRILDLGSSPG